MVVIPAHNFEQDIEGMSAGLALELRVLFESMQEEISDLFDQAIKNGWSVDRLMAEIGRKIQ